MNLDGPDYPDLTDYETYHEESYMEDRFDDADLYLGELDSYTEPCDECGGECHPDEPCSFPSAPDFDEYDR